MTISDDDTTISPARRARETSEYWFSRKLAEVRRLDTPDLRVLNLGIGSPDLAPSRETIETLVDAARRRDTHAYQSYRGIPKLREAIAAYQHDVFGATLDPESEILPLMGSKEGIFHISMAFVDEGDEVLLPDPGYPTYASVAKLAGGIPRTYRVREAPHEPIDFDALEREDLARVKLMWINFPHMPTGRSASRAGLERLLDTARRHRFLLVNDNPYAMIGSSERLSLLSIPGARDVALELGSLSKSHNMAGWRVGWVAGRREHVDLVLRVRSNMDSGMFLPVQLAAAKALESRDEWFAALNATYAERRREANEILSTLGCTFEDGQSGLFAWGKAPDDVDDVEAWLDEILRETKVFLTPGFVFGEAGRRFVRVSLCSPLDVMREARDRLGGRASRANARRVHAPRPEPFTTSPRETRDDFGRDVRPPLAQPQFTLAVVGLGLIGGSIATDLRLAGLVSHIVGIDANPEHAEIALRRGLVDETRGIDASLDDADAVLLAIPVDDIERLLPDILDRVRADAVVVDTGSTKQSICGAVASHPRRSRFVAAHPIAGTENSGPDAALSGLFRGKVNLVCERERSSEDALAAALRLFDALGMRTIFMGAREHDLHLAYVSHLSHVTSFILGQTVLDIENDETSIFDLAGSGFASTVRLAKSSPAMWAPIFERNAPFLGKAIDEYITHLQRFRQALESRDVMGLHRIMTEANDIRRILSNMERSADASSAISKLEPAFESGADAPQSIGEPS